MIKLLPFHSELGNAWKTFIDRWGSAAVLQLLTIIPAFFMAPLVSEYSVAYATGADTFVAIQSSVYVTQFVIGFILFILIGVFVTASTGILFAAKKKLSLLVVIQTTLARYIPVLYTSVLAALAVIISLIPAFALRYGYEAFARGGAPVTNSGLVAVDAIVLIAVVALLIPAAIVTTWVMYAPLATSLKAAPGGFTSIMFSKHIVRNHVWQLLLRMIGSMVLFQVASKSVITLPYVSYLVPFFLSIILIAFFVEIYKELQEA